MSQRRTVQFVLLMTTALMVLAFALLVDARLSGNMVAAQPEQQGVQADEKLPVVVMPPVDNTAEYMQLLDELAPGVPVRFAKPLTVNITPAFQGARATTGDGFSTWRIRIVSPGAVSLNFGFTGYFMPEGGSLLLYSPDYSQVRGPFTVADNETHGQLWTPLLLSDDVILEVKLPTNKINELVLELSSVNHGFMEFGRTPDSGACNVDVVCPEGDLWEAQIQSVAVISTGGSTFCTGFLVNNTAHDLRPYFMTANHCSINAGNAASLVAYWNYYNSTCRPPGSPQSGQPGDGTLTQFNTGSIFRSAYAPSDFTLVELDDPINPVYNPFWAGWNNGAGDYSGGIAIHHPNTEEKRISFENEATTTTTYLGTTSPGDGTHVRITDWDLGTTEPGSSGSPLFSPAGHVVGQLHGGYAACGNDLSDWYGRFSVSWTGGGSDSTRLSNWLDPAGGTVILDGQYAAPFGVTATPASQDICVPTDALYTVNVTSIGGFNNPVVLSVTGNPAGTTVGFSTNPVTPPGSSTLTIGNTTAAAAGSYNINIMGTSGVTTTQTTVGLNVYTVAPSAPTLTSPANGATGVSTSPTLVWAAVSGTADYTVEVATDAGFTNIVFTDTLAGTNTTANGLNANTTYYWRVRGQNTCGTGVNSTIFSFVTGQQYCATPALSIPDNSPAGVFTEMVVGDTGTLTDMDVSLNVTHTWVGDLIFTLQHVDTGTTVIMIDRPGVPVSTNGCSGNDIQATLNDEGADGPVEIMCANAPALFGEPVPNNPLSALDGENLSGTWRLTVSDNAGADTGVVNEWCLLPTASGGPTPTPTATATATATPTQVPTATPTQPPTDVQMSNLDGTQPRSGWFTLFVGVVLLGLTGWLYLRRQHTN